MSTSGLIDPKKGMLAASKLSPGSGFLGAGSGSFSSAAGSSSGTPGGGGGGAGGAFGLFLFRISNSGTL